MSLGPGLSISCSLGKAVTEQDRDGIRRVRQEPVRCAEPCWPDALALPSPLSFLPGVEEKALPGVTVLGPLSQEEVVENKACTRLHAEGVVLQ